MMGSENVIVEVSDHVAVVTLDRSEELNVLNGDMADSLIQNCKSLAKDIDVRCVVLTGAGRAFCAGSDMQTFTRNDGVRGKEPASIQRRDEVSTLREREEVSILLSQMPKPTIAMINGVAMGAGLSLALACDLRFAAESARMRVGFLQVALSGDFGGAWFMQRLLGPARARELYFLDEAITGKDAERIGLVNRVVADDQLRQKTMELAQRLAGAPPLAAAFMKQNLNLALLSDLSSILDAEAEWQTLCRHTEDHVEGVRAFIDKRRPIFKGR